MRGLLKLIDFCDCENLVDEVRKCETLYSELDIGSRPSDHYFRCVCLSVCAEFFSAVFDPISVKLGHTLYVWI